MTVGENVVVYRTGAVNVLCSLFNNEQYNDKLAKVFDLNEVNAITNANDLEPAMNCSA